MPFDLIIWDCDGCLVDSEVISCGVGAQILTDWGYPISTRENIDRFAGKGDSEVKKIIEEETGRPCDIARRPEKKQALLAAFEKDLKPTDGLMDILDGLQAPQCIASGSGFDHLACALRVTGLSQRFENKIFSSSQVPHGKPAPDVFLFAAAQMETTPEKCLVIEDSVFGIQAAKAAGMTVFAYLGGSHVNDAWRTRIEAEAPHVIFDDMRQLPSLIEAYA
jgi:HAD superfamily hydrolase (TIGR01509 family)